MKRLLILLILIASFAQAQPATTRPAPKTLIGVWYQPTSSFQKWKDRGVNCLVGIEMEGGNVKAADYCAAAHAMGFYVIGADKNADAFQQVDEADTGKMEPPEYIAAYKACKVIAPMKPVFGSFSGGKTQWRAEADYVQYMTGVDWASEDFYPANSGSFSADAAASAAGWDFYTSRIDYLVRVAKGKPVFVFIECSDQNLRVGGWLHTPENQPQGELWAGRMRCPTADEMEREVTIATAHGAAGVIYFPQRIGFNFESFDTTPPDVEARMKLVNAKLAGKATPPGPATAPADNIAGTMIQLPDGRKYRFERVP